MYNYNFTEKFYSKSGNEIKFNYKGEIESQITDNVDGWKTYKMEAIIDNNLVGFINVSNINSFDFDSKYSILNYLELYKGWDLNLDIEKRKLKAIELGLKESDESIFILSEINLLKRLSKYIYKFNSNKFDFYNEIGCLSSVKNEMMNFIYEKYGKEYSFFKDETINKSIVEYIEVDKNFRDDGIGKCLYQAAGLWCSYNNLNLHSSYNQSESATITWSKMKENKKIPIKLNNLTNFYFLDYQPYLKDKFNSQIFLFGKKLNEISNDDDLNKKIIMLWARGNPEYGMIYREQYKLEGNKEVSLIFNENPIFKENKITINEKIANKIFEVLNKMPPKYKESFEFLDDYFVKNVKLSKKNIIVN